MSLPKEPRQQMINMMYLVLTAMLALNITREVLTAFQTINSSIEKSNGSISDKNNFYYDQFNKAEENKADYDKVKPWNDKAKIVKRLSDELVVYLGTWKDSVVAQSGGYITNNNGQKEVKSMEDIDAATRLFIDRNHGEDIKVRLNRYIDTIVGLVPQDMQSSLRSQMFQIPDKVAVTEENPTGSWVYGTFHNIPVVAVQAMMSKFQNDVKNAEATVVKYMFDQIHASDMKFDELMAVAVPNNSYVLEGDEIEAKIAVVAYNKNLNPNISSNVGAVQVQDGIGTLKFKASGQGVRTINGTINITTQRGAESFPYKFDIMVGTQGGSLQLDKMNVMYIGVPNPVTVAAAGYNIQDVKLSIPGASKVTPTQGKGTYEVWVDKQTNDLPWSISAIKAGKTNAVAEGKIRVKVIPPPTATLGGKSSGFMSSSTAKAQPGIIAKLENFDFDTRFDVISFRFAYVPKNGTALEEANTGPAFNNTIKTYMSRSKPGDKWFVDEIKVKGPDGRIQTINPLAITLN